MNATRLSVRSLAALVLCIVPTAPVLAGVADSPLPVLTAGQKTLHLYSVPGILRLSCAGMYFSCTSMDTAAMQAAVEVFSPAGGGPCNDAAATSVSIAPGASVVFGTGSATDFGIDSNLGTSNFCTSARILATSTKLACSAYIADRCNSPVAFITPLTIIKKTTQKAAN